jgi:hypothetical protein
MALSNDLATLFAKTTQDKQDVKKESTSYGKIVKQGDKTYVQLDGSDLLTPIETTTVVQDEDRVMVTIKDHTAIVTGDLTTPAASNKDVIEIGDKIAEFEIVIADKVTTQDLEAINAYIEHIKGVTAKYEELTAITAEIETLQAKYADMEHITAKDAEIINAEIETLKVKLAEFTSISTDDLEAIYAEFDNVVAYNASFTYVSAEVLNAIDANIKNLQTNKLDTETAKITYANIDFSNIGEAAIEKLFSDSGIIEDLIMSDGKVTGELVGVTIKGDLIEGNTVKADKLVVLGTDGLYYKLNVNALGETTASSDEKYQNGLDGSVIVAESITAEKIAVDDLVAFKATIGGFHIGDHSLYSGVKNSVSNTTQGIFMSDDGQINVGDGNNFFKYYKDQNGNYKLEIQASSIKFGASKTTIEEAIQGVSDKVDNKVNLLSGDPTNYSQLNDNTASYWGFTADNTSDGHWYTINNLARNVYISNHYECSGGEVFAISYEISTSCYARLNALSESQAIMGYAGTTIGIVTSDDNGSSSFDYIYAQRVTASADAPVVKISSQVVIPNRARKFRVFVQTEAWSDFSGTIKVRNVSVRKAVNEVEIGGRNLFLNTATWFNENQGGRVGGCESYTFGEDISTPSGHYAVFNTGTQNSNAGHYYTYTALNSNLLNILEENETYTFSCYAKSDINLSIQAQSLCESQTLVNYTGNSNGLIPITTEWKRYEVVFRYTNTTKFTICFYVGSDSRGLGANLYMSSPKLEKGNQATDWTEAPEDIDADISYVLKETNQQITNLDVKTDGIYSEVSNIKTIQTSTSESIDIINNNITTLTESVNTKVDSDSVDIAITTALSNGVDKVKTTTKGFTFDDEGLTISDSSSEMSTVIDENGMEIKRNEDTQLLANNEGVIAYDLHAKTYLIVGENSRFEDYVRNGKKQTGCFWIGDAEVND